MPPVAPVRTAPVQTPRTDNTMLKRMMDDLTALDTKLSAVAVGEGRIIYLRDFSEGGAFSSFDDRHGSPAGTQGGAGQAPSSEGGLWDGPFSEN